MRDLDRAILQAHAEKTKEQRAKVEEEAEAKRQLEAFGIPLVFSDYHAEWKI